MKRQVAELKNRKDWIIFTLGFGIFVVALNEAMLKVASVPIMKDLGNFPPQFRWVTNTYLLALVSPLVFFAWLSQYGDRKKLLQTGIAIFALSALSAGVTTNTVWLSIFRLSQGLGASLIFGATYSFAINQFDSKERSRLLGLFTATLGLVLLLAPLLGEHFAKFGLGQVVNEMFAGRSNWHQIFLIDLPLCLMLIFLTIKVLPRTIPQYHRSNFLNDALMAGAICLSCLGLLEGQRLGWFKVGEPETFLGLRLSFFGLSVVPFIFALSIILLALSLKSSARVDRGGLKINWNRIFAATSLFFFLTTLVIFFSAILFTLQKLLNLSGFEVSKALLPLLIPIIIMAPLVQVITNYLSSKLVAIAGILITLTGLFLMGEISYSASRLDLILPFLVLGLGISLCLPVLEDFVITSTEDQNHISLAQGLAASLLPVIVGLSASNFLLQRDLTRQTINGFNKIDNLQSSVRERVAHEVTNGNFITGADGASRVMDEEFNKILDSQLPTKAYVLSLPEAERTKLKAQVIEKQNTTIKDLSKLASEMGQVLKEGLMVSSNGLIGVSRFIPVLSLLALLFYRPRKKNYFEESDENPVVIQDRVRKINKKLARRKRKR